MTGKRKLLPKVLRKLLCIVALALFAAVSLQIFAFTPQVFAQETISIDVEAGYNGVAKMGSQVSFRVGVQNNGGDISGEVQVLIPGPDQTQKVYAMPAELPAQSSKVIVLSAPYNYSIDKTEIRFVSRNKTVARVKYSFNKLIEPSTPIIGILCDDPDVFRGLKSVDINLVNHQEMMNEYGVNYAAGVYYGAGAKYATRVDKMGNMITGPAEIVYLDSSSITGEPADLSAINAIILSNYDTGKLNDIQVRSLEQWVEAGGLLITGTGINAQKVYSGLTDKLKQFKITGSGRLEGYQALGDAIEKTVPEGGLDIAIGIIGSSAGGATGGSTGDGTVLLKGVSPEDLTPEGLTPNQVEYPLAISYQIGNGCEIVLAYDPSLEPIAGWVDSAQLMAYLINEGTKTLGRKAGAGAGVNISSLNYLTSNVPESAAPPFGLIAIILAIYLAIVGPILYILLKKKDKRDWSWLIIPALAFVFMFVIYGAGFKSRYTTAVLNTFSIIDIDAETGEGKVSSTMAAFNNKKGTFRIEYDSSKSIATSVVGYNNYYSSDPTAANNFRRTTEKIIYSDKRINEYYDVGIWEKVTLNGNTEIETDGAIIQSASLSGGMFSASIENNTPFELKESFITIGDSVIEIGDILPGETREISEQLNNLKTISEYLNSKYYIDYSNTSRRERTELDRKRSIINGLARNSFVNLDYLVNLYAFNDSHIDYGIIVNGAQPVNYDTNVILAHTGDLFRESGVVELPYGTIVPYIIPDKGFYYDSGPDGYIQIDMEAEVYVDFEIPAQLAVEEFTVSWSSKLNNNFGGSAKQAGFTFEIYNNEAQDWEEFTDSFTPSGESNKYIDNTNRVRLKLVGEKINGVQPQGHFVLPRITVRGAAR